MQPRHRRLRLDASGQRIKGLRRAMAARRNPARLRYHNIQMFDPAQDFTLVRMSCDRHAALSFCKSKNWLNYRLDLDPILQLHTGFVSILACTYQCILRFSRPACASTSRRFNAVASGNIEVCRQIWTKILLLWKITSSSCCPSIRSQLQRPVQQYCYPAPHQHSSPAHHPSSGIVQRRWPLSPPRHHYSPRP